MPKIANINCHKIINSRGDWTIRTRVILDDGSVGIQTIPEGVSSGKKEAVYVPVEKAVKIVSEVLSEALRGEDALNQGRVDSVLVELDGTREKKKLGAKVTR